jgi:hypothetical protein
MGLKKAAWTDQAAANSLVTKSTGVNTASIPGTSRSTNLDTAALSALSEAQWQEVVVGLARAHGWNTFHCRKVKVKRGKREWWETTMPAGWFDLVLARASNRSHRDSLYFVECKVRPNVQTDEQKAAEKLFTACGQTCFLWYPEHWPAVQQILSMPVEE